MRKIGFFVKENLYQSKYHFTRKFAEALERQGISTFIIDTDKLEPEHVEKIRRQSPDMTCSFNTILPLTDGSFLWDFLEIPHLSILVDPAIYYMSLIQSPYSVLSCVDRFECDLVKAADFPNVFFLPHAVEKELLEEPLTQDRPYDIVLVGSCYDHESLRKEWQERYPKPICDAIDRAVEIVLSQPTTTFVQALLEAWNSLSIDPTDVDFLPIFTYIDNYARGKDRDDLLRSLKDFNVHVFGSCFWEDKPHFHGWDYYLKSEKHITLHPAVRFEEVMPILKKSKICLNSTPFFKNGSHERVFASLATGCAVISSENLYLRESFNRGEGVSLYQHKKLDPVKESVEYYLSNEKRRQQEVKEGRQKVAAYHTWDQRAQQLIQEMPPIFGRIYARIVNPN